MEKLQAALEKARGERQGQPARHTQKTRVQQPSSSEPDSIQERWAALPVFAPNENHLIHNRIMTYSISAQAMPFDMLRTKILLMMRQNNWTRLAITSPEPNCGKTTLACNMAFGFSRQQDLRTMLLDFDMRKPSVAAVLGHGADAAIDTVLSGESLPQEHMCCVNENLAISMVRTSVVDPMKTVMSPQTPEVLDQLQEDFQPDLMIFDLAPMLAVDETRAILKYVDCAIIVARAEQTRMGRLDMCEREVSEYTNVLGMVLNNCRYSDTHDSYGEEGY